MKFMRILPCLAELLTEKGDMLQKQETLAAFHSCRKGEEEEERKMLPKSGPD